MDISSVTTPLAELQRRLSVIRDRVQGVALGYHTGFYLFGRPGTSKTFTVRSTLDDLGTKYAYHSGYLTPFGLFDLLQENHDRIVLLDDVASIFDQKPALQLLLAALGNQSTNREVRLVKYKQKNYEEEVRFSGGIIALSNLRLHTKPVLNALKSRVNYLKYEPSDEQIEGLMRQVASQEWTAPRGKKTLITIPMANCGANALRWLPTMNWGSWRRRLSSRSVEAGRVCCRRKLPSASSGDPVSFTEPRRTAATSRFMPLVASTT